MTDTRTALIEEATRLVRTRGYSGFSYADLASAVGIRTASIHYHFPAKEDLGSELISTYSNQVLVAFKEIDKQGRGALWALERYVDLYRPGLSEGLACLYGMYVAEVEAIPEGIREGLARFLAINLDWLARVVSEGQRSGEIRADLDPAGVAQSVLANCQGAVMIARATRDHEVFEGAMNVMLGSVRSPGD